jgi:fimbrial isopeptide formation D2 family protein/uncharacterized repeat protein (TIGR01451 family)
MVRVASRFRQRSKLCCAGRVAFGLHAARVEGVPVGFQSRTRALPPFLALEDRALLAAQPIATVDSVEVPIGGTTQITITFDNQPDSSPGGDVGYAPYVDLILPANGADGATSAPQDGVTFQGASFLGVALAATVVTFDAAGEAIHPFARDAAGDLRVVRAADYGAAPGDELVVLRLPFGSFVADQPPAEITVSLGLSPLADLGVNLPVSVVGGFAFGLDALNNPTVDPPVLGPIGTGTITPTLITLEKSFDGPENETATGPNFPRNYTITLDLAAGQTITNAVIRDRLPDGIVVNGPITLTGAAGTATFDPLTNSVTATLSGAVTGVAGVEATLTIPFFVGQFLTPGQPGVPVLDPVTGAARLMPNDVQAEADWTPLDPRDVPERVVIDPAGPEQEFTARSIATQKSQAILVDAGAPGLGPGDTLRYTIEVQVSDYFTFDGLRVTDLLSDGQAYVAGSARIEVLEAGSTAGSGLFALPFLAFTRDAATGVTRFDFDVSGQLLANGAADGVLVGGDGGLGPTVFRISYQALVESRFVANGEAVGQGDRLSNAATVQGDVLDGAGNPTGGQPTDGTASGGEIATGGITKDVYALNGAILVPGAPVRIAAGDLVTFRLTYALPQTLTSELRITDYLPLPVFDVNLFTLALDGTVSPDAPGLNTAKFGPLAGGFAALLTTVPILTFNSAANSLTFTFEDLAPATPAATVADILFTLRVQDRPFGDGLLLTNQVLAQEFNTQGVLVADDSAIRQVTLTEPALRLTKGVVAADNGNIPGFQPQFTSTPVGPVAFTPPGSAGVRFSGTIDSAALAAQSVDSDIRRIDGGAIVTFAIVVENTGTGRDGAFDVTVRDLLPQGYVAPPGGFNLQVTDGAGNALAFTGDLFAGGITLTDPAPNAGALRPFLPTTAPGANILVITYDVLVNETPQPRSQLTNLSEITNYAALEGGNDLTANSPGPVLDDATATIADPTFTKTAIATSLTQTVTGQGDPNLFDLAIGETVTFELVATLREGRTRGLVITDLLPQTPGQLRFESALVTSIGDRLFVRAPDGSFATPLPNPTVTSTPTGVTFTFADDIINAPDNLLNDDDRIVLRVTAVVTDVPGNQAGVLLENTGRMQFTAGGGTVTLTDRESVEVVAPNLALTKTADRATVQGGDIVTYTVEGTLPAGGFSGPLFDITVTDVLLPGQITLVPSSATLVSAPAGATLSEAGGVIILTLATLLPGESYRFTYQGLVASTVVAGSALTNVAASSGDSFPGVPPLGIERPFTDSANATVTVPGPGIAKTVVAADTSLAETGTGLYDPARVDLAIGETVTYRLTVTFPEALSIDVSVLDFLPGAVGPIPLPPGFGGLLELLSASVTRIGGNLSGIGLATIVPVALDTNGDTIEDTVRFDLGDVLNSTDGVVTPADQIEFAVTARVRDAGANLAGVVARNTAEVDFGGQFRRATADVDIVEPAVGIDKTASASTGDAGDRVSFRITLPNNAPEAGPAFGLRVVDVLPLGFAIDLATLGFVGTAPAGASLSYDALTRSVIASFPRYLTTDPLVTIGYDAIVENGVFPEQRLQNTASLTFTSHPPDPMVPDDSLYIRDYGPLRDSTVFVVEAPTLSKRVVSTDIASTQFLQLNQTIQDVAVGETVTYLLTLRLPEATTDLVLQDLLPRAVGSPPIAGDMRWVASEIVSLGANLSFGPTAPGVGDTGVVTSRFNDGVLDTITWNFGRVVNTPDGVQDDEDLIIVSVTAIVPNRPANQPGDSLINVGQATYSLSNTPGDTRVLAQSETVEIVGPALAITKTPSIASGDAGDEILYTVTIAHTSASTGWAYDLTLEDLLGPGLRLVAGSVTASLPGAVVTQGNTPGDTTITLTLPELQGPVAVAGVVGETLTVTYRAILADAVRHGQTVPNKVHLDWQSAPAGFVEARAESASAEAQVAVVLTPTLTKVAPVANSSLAETGSRSFNPALPDLAAGETMTYVITLTLGEGTQRVLLEDALPAGLAFVSGEVIEIGPGITGSLLDVGDGPTQIGASLRFDFGSAVINTGDNDPNTGVIRVEVTARAVPGQAAGTVLTNSAALTTDSGTLRAAAPVEVVRPDVAITKTASVPTGNAADEVTFTVTVAQRPGASGPLYGLEVEDVLPAGYILVAGSASATRGTVTQAGNTLTLDLGTGVLLPTDDPLTPGNDAEVVLTYRAIIANTVRDGDVLLNGVRFEGVSAPNLPPDQVDTVAGDAVAPVQVVLPIAFAKTIVATSLPETGTGFFDPTRPDLAVGETVTYQLAATLGEGTQRVVLQDVLPAGLVFVSGRVLPLDPTISGALPASPVVSGQTVTFDFGNAVVNAGDNDPTTGIIRVEITARVLPGTTAGTVLTNAGSFITDTRTLTDAASADVVAPDVAITKVASVPTGDAGDEVTFTVVVAQQPGATGPLYALVVEDALPSSYVLIAGSATATRGTVTEFGNAVRLDLGAGVLLPTDDPGTPVEERGVTITYRARLADGVEPGQVVINTAIFSGESAPGLPPGQTDISLGTASADVTVVMPVALTKAIVETSLPGTPGASLNVGETVTYRLTATLSEGTQTLVITDTLPAGLEILDAFVTPGGIGSGLPPGLAGVAATISGQTVTFDFGTVVNLGDNDPANDSISVDIVARVRDVPGNVAGTTLTNDASVTIAAPSGSGVTETDRDQVTATVVEPILVLDKAAPPGFLRPGETVTYTLTLTHDAASTSAAYDVVIADLLADPNLDLVEGSVTTSQGVVELGNSVGDTTLRARVDVLALGETVTITFTARVADTTPSGVTLSNLAVTDYDSATGPGGRPGTTQDDANIPGVPGLTKAITSTSNPDTGSDQFDPTRPDLAIGETLTYTLVLTLPSGLAEDLLLTDLLPAGVEPTAARVVNITGGIVAGTPLISVTGQQVRFDFGDVTNTNPGAATITLEVDARVLDLPGLDAGALLINEANLAFTIGGRAGTLDAFAPADLVEPELIMGKTVDQLSGDAVDSFTYTVVFAHAPGSTSAAYGITLTDILDPRLEPVSVTSTAGNATITGNTVELTLDRLLLTEGPVVLTYVVRMREVVEPGQTIGNRADLAWGSDPITVGRPDETVAFGPDITAVFSLDLAKSIVDSSIPETGFAAFDPARPDLTVGEIVFYEIAATLAEGTQDLVITDRLPEGFVALTDPALTRVVATGALVAAGGSLTPVAVFSPDGRTVTFSFGTLVNPGTDRLPPMGPEDVVRVQIAARVLDEAINTSGRVAFNDAGAEVSAPTVPGAPGGTITASVSAAADIVLPELDIAKAVDQPTGDAGDVFTYTLTLTAGGTDTGPAFNVVVEDVLPALLAAVPGSVTTSFGSATLAGNTIRIEIPVLLPDAPPIVITYRAAFTDAVQPGDVVPNLATLVFDSAPTDGRRFADDATASVATVFGLTLDKQIVATSLPETGTGFFDPALLDISAGETVTYRLIATLSEGTQTLVIRDALPPGLIAESARLVTLGDGVSAGPPVILLLPGSVTFDFGTVVNSGAVPGGDTVEVEVVARRDVTQPAGAVLTNTADAEVRAPRNPLVALTATDSASVEAVAAVLVFDKQAGPAALALGNTITYTLTLSHDGSSTAPAYGVVLLDPLSDASVQLVAGSVTASLGTVTTGNGAGDTSVRIDLSVLLPGQVLTVTFQALAVGVPIPDGVSVNTAAFGSSSAPGPLPLGFNLPLAGIDSAAVAISSALPAGSGGLLAAYDEALRRIANNQLNAPAILAGTAQPAAAVLLQVRDANGAPVSVVGVTADVGGNWMANPIATGAPAGGDAAALAPGQIAGIQVGQSGANLPAAPAAAPQPVPTSAPYTVQASETPAAFDTRTAMDGVRATFGGALQPGGFFTTATEAPAPAANAQLGASVDRQQAGLQAPQSLAWNRFALDFAAAAAAASVAAR